MVDFVRILKKTIDAQGNATTQLRERVYERAVDALERKFIEEKVSKAVIERQRKSLRDAITIVEEGYLALDKELLSSAIGWRFTDEWEGDRIERDFVSSQSDSISVLGTERERKISVVDANKNGESYTSSEMITVPDAEFVNMGNLICEMDWDLEERIVKNSRISSVAGDNVHIVSHIFSQALRRANRSSLKKRILVGIFSFISFTIFLISIFLISKRIFVLKDHSLQEFNIYTSDVSATEAYVDRKLTQRLLEDGSEIDAGFAKDTKILNDEEVLAITTSEMEAVEYAGEAVLYQMRTDYETENVVTGEVQWSLIRGDATEGKSEELAIRGDMKIPDEGVSLRLVLHRNVDSSLPAAYIMDLIFITSDKFLGQAISNIKALTFKVSEQSAGQALTKTSIAKVDDNFFLIALSGHHPFLNRNLQLMRQLDWIHLIMDDKNGRTNELIFSKGRTGKKIFNEVIGKWFTQDNQPKELDSIKKDADIGKTKSIPPTGTVSPPVGP
ncbi:hypothetical protein [Bartonella ancashensis]|uniref:Transmembrane protein n=1 Tax=Bartonella ancashensis TaxID=1318743 RepID=A0A0M4LIH0_9HYPH|nr:hypothetical protein [Bartonella ancashensis]ALE02839.1 hypothetical protein PU02_0025 [Bartonella ancashensis]